MSFFGHTRRPPSDSSAKDRPAVPVFPQEEETQTGDMVCREPSDDATAGSVPKPSLPSKKTVPTITTSPAAVPSGAPTAAPPSGGDTVARDRSLYKALLDGMYDAILMIDPNGNVIVANRRAGKFFGYPPDDLWGMRIESLIESLNMRVRNHIRHHLETGRFTLLSTTCRRADGSSFAGEIALSIIDFLNHGDMIISIRNIDRRIAAEDDRAAVEETVRQMGTAAACCNRLGRIVFANAAFPTVFGLSPDASVLNRHISEFWHNRKADVIMQKGLANESWSGMLIAVMPDGRRVEGVATCTSQKGKGGRVIRIFVTFTPLPGAAAPSSPQPPA